jgi:hypothetical protein
MRLDKNVPNLSLYWFLHRKFKDATQEKGGSDKQLKMSVFQRFSEF